MKILMILAPLSSGSPTNIVDKANLDNEVDQQTGQQAKQQTFGVHVEQKIG